MNSQLNRYLRKVANEDRNGTQTIKENMDHIMENVENMLIVCFGTPPHKDEKKKISQDICDMITTTLKTYVFLVCADYQMNKKYIGPMYNDPDNPNQDVWYNVSIENLQKYAKKMLQLNLPVWFTADINTGFDSKRGIMHEKAFIIGVTSQLDTTETRKERINSKNASPNHAMLLTSVSKDFDDATSEEKFNNALEWRGSEFMGRKRKAQ